MADAAQLTCPVLLPKGPDAALVCGACTRHGVGAVACSSFSELLGRLDQSCGTVILGAEVLTRRHGTRLDNWFAREPEWSELPLVLLMPARSGRMRPVAFEKSLLERNGTTVLRRPTDEATLLCVVKAGLAARLNQYRVRDLLADLRRANRRLDARTRQLRHLALVVAQAEEAERRRVAHTLHDGLQQLLAAARIALRGTSDCDSDNDQRTAAVQAVDAILKEALASSRRLTRDLSPPILYEAGLGPALEQFAERMAAERGLAIEVAWEKGAAEMSATMRAFLFEATRELIANIERHAGTTNARVELDVADKLTRLSVEDDGAGFDPAVLDKDADGDAGFGLFGIRERAELLGGSFRVDSEPGNGTRVTLAVPLEAAETTAR